MSNGISLADLAVRFGCSVRGDPQTVVRRVGTLEAAEGDALAFLANAKYRRFLASTRAAAVIIEPSMADASPVPALLAKNPYAVYARVAALLHPAEGPAAGIHPTAVVDPSASIDSTVSVGPGAFIGAGCVIGARALIGPHCVLMRDVTVGADTRLTASVTLCDRITVGERCVLHPGVVIGADGFGFAADRGEWVKVPQVGAVRVGNDVEIGANTTIDRGAIEDTIIEDGVKLDNQIQIGHNVRIGAHTVIAACTGVSGSTTIGKRCMIGGFVGFAGHITVCDDVVITGKSSVSNSLRKPGVYSSTIPVEEVAKFNRNIARLRHLDELAKTVKRLVAANPEAPSDPGARDLSDE